MSQYHTARCQYIIMIKIVLNVPENPNLLRCFSHGTNYLILCDKLHDPVGEAITGEPIVLLNQLLRRAMVVGCHLIVFK